MIIKEFKGAVYKCDFCGKTEELRDTELENKKHFFEIAPKGWIKTENNFGNGSVCSKECLFGIAEKYAEKEKNRILNLLHETP